MENITDIPDAEEMASKTEARQNERNQNWEDFNTKIRPVFISVINRIVHDDTAIYWGCASLKIKIGKAEEQYLIDKGYSIIPSDEFNSYPKLCWPRKTKNHDDTK